MPRQKRNIFLYLDPMEPMDEFAQCSTCRDWIMDDDKCVIHSQDVDVPGTVSCGLYVHGIPQVAGTPCLGIVTPEESGLVDREVRCENCTWFNYHPTDGDTCGFFELLNYTMPDVFDLDTFVHEKGCCNAQQPPEETD